MTDRNERIALDLMKIIGGQTPMLINSAEKALALYAKCLDAVDEARKSDK